MPGEPYFFSEGSTPRRTDTKWKILQKILGAIRNNFVVSTGNSSGIGSPEGVVTANVSSIYFDITDPNNPIQYVKSTGSGNTGWV